MPTPNFVTYAAFTEALPFVHHADIDATISAIYRRIGVWTDAQIESAHRLLTQRRDAGHQERHHQRAPAARPRYPARPFMPKGPEVNAERRTLRTRLANLPLIPIAMAGTLTPAMAAVLTIIARQIAALNECTLAVANIAKRAGVCIRMVQMTIKKAVEAGCLWKQPRPQRGHANDTNVLLFRCKHWEKAASDRADRVQTPACDKERKYKKEGKAEIAFPNRRFAPTLVQSKRVLAPPNR